MKKVFIFVFTLCISLQLFAELKTKQVVGKWKYTVVTDQSSISGSIKFIEKEGELAGEVYTDDGGIYPLTKIEIREGDVLYFELKPEYDVIKVKVTIEGKKFKGTGTTYDGEFMLTGEKTEE